MGGFEGIGKGAPVGVFAEFLESFRGDATGSAMDDNRGLFLGTGRCEAERITGVEPVGANILPGVGLAARLAGVSGFPGVDDRHSTRADNSERVFRNHGCRAFADADANLVRMRHDGSEGAVKALADDEVLIDDDFGPEGEAAVDGKVVAGDHEITLDSGSGTASTEHNAVVPAVTDRLGESSFFERLHQPVLLATTEPDGVGVLNLLLGGGAI